MKFIIEGNCVKAFGRAVHALSRIGDELWLDPMVKGLAVRSVNSTHSAAACFLFSPLFFQHYSPAATGSKQNCEDLKCKLTMKSVLPLFRGIASIERNVDKCQITIDTADSRVVFKFHCKHGMTKTHNLGFQESDPLQAVFAFHLCPNVLKAQARLLGDMVMHFPVFQEEVTLSITSLTVSLKNYYEEGNDHMKRMNTEMSLNPSEFDYFQVGKDSDITFCLKELRGMLSFAESHGLPVSAHFGTAGTPIRFSVEDMVLEANVVLATLVDPESRGPSQTVDAPAPPLASVTPRCTDAAATQEVERQAEASPNQAFPHVAELIASSQGSPLLISAAMIGQPPKAKASDLLNAADKGHANTITAPASAKVRSLLFGALSDDQGDVDCSSILPVLAHSSDTEEDPVGDASA